MSQVNDIPIIEAIEFTNFKALRNAELPLSQFTLIVGPNGSGKSTVLQGLRWLRGVGINFDHALTIGVPRDDATRIVMTIRTRYAGKRFNVIRRLTPRHHNETDSVPRIAGNELYQHAVWQMLQTLRTFSLVPERLSQPVKLSASMNLLDDGLNLAGVLDRLRDQHPERFEQLNEELARWLPEFDRILFDTPMEGHRAIQLRTRKGQARIPASELSTGTLLALTILTIAYIPDSPKLVALEEPDHGLHPRLLRDVRDALYRLAYPDRFGESRPPVQVIATTHSPYFLDLFRDHPEEVVIAKKEANEATFQRLSDMPNVEEILEDSQLGDAWYSGVLGGVPVAP
ncbi:MAG: AAA family ATPase [Phycisphaerae bacterium]|nr:AAA family ATPase [Phycisphaerae bacterium]NUQ47089.1 AAA family ATPase [Phycisphaerae bacterium]